MNQQHEEPEYVTVHRVVQLPDHPTVRRVMTAGIVLGAGLGGFFDGILFHQILQAHSMLSAMVGRTTVVGLEVNMFWDGLFHAVTWTLTLVGLALVWHAAARARVLPRSSVLIGGALVGWGAFNLIEGAIDHHLLGVHHVIENGNHLLPDLAFLFSGGVLVLLGWRLLRPSLPMRPSLPSAKAESERPMTPIEHRG